LTCALVGSNTDVVIIGHGAGNDNILAAVRTVIIGKSAGTGLTSGNDNTFVGNSSGGLITSGFENTIIGSNAHNGTNGVDYDNSVIIGKDAQKV